jgi:uncharacterized protein CbrC (UPF0167 family)
MVTLEHALEGLTHGVPGLSRDDFELIPTEGEPEWMRARVDPSLLLELVRTPSYHTWQGERWQFCCGRPAVFVGEWKEKDFSRRTVDGKGKALFEKAKVVGLDSSAWGHFNCMGGPYMFRCCVCAGLLGHYDMD